MTKTAIETALSLVSKASKDIQEAQRILTEARFKELQATTAITGPSING